MIAPDFFHLEKLFVATATLATTWRYGVLASATSVPVQIWPPRQAVVWLLDVSRGCS